MLSRNHPDWIQITFGDPRLAATLARHLGLPQLVQQRLDLGNAPDRANTGDKMMTLVVSALAGGDCIDDADALRTGGGPGFGQYGHALPQIKCHRTSVAQGPLADPVAKLEIAGHRRRKDPPQRIGGFDLHVPRACARPLLIPHLFVQWSLRKSICAGHPDADPVAISAVLTSTEWIAEIAAKLPAIRRQAGNRAVAAMEIAIRSSPPGCRLHGPLLIPLAPGKGPDSVTVSGLPEGNSAFPSVARQFVGEKAPAGFTGEGVRG